VNCRGVVFLYFGGFDGKTNKIIFLLDFGIGVAKVSAVVVSTGNQWTEIVIIVTRLLFRSRRNQKERKTKNENK
jgi:hypothetical protein